MRSAGLRFAPQWSVCILHKKLLLQRIATQIWTHRPDRIDLYDVFPLALSPRNGFTAYFALSPVTTLV